MKREKREERRERREERGERRRRGEQRGEGEERERAEKDEMRGDKQETYPVSKFFLTFSQICASCFVIWTQTFESSLSLRLALLE